MEEKLHEQAIITTIKNGEEFREGVYADFDQENYMIYLYNKKYAELWIKAINPRSPFFVSIEFTNWEK